MRGYGKGRIKQSKGTVSNEGVLFFFKFLFISLRERECVCRLGASARCGALEVLLDQ